MRRAALLAVGLAMLAPVAARASPPAISAVVDGTRGQAGWYVSPVVIHWSVMGADSTSGCEAAVSVTDDTAGTKRTCTAANADGSAGADVIVRIDKTPPVAVSATPERAPDAGAWFTRPVAIAWTGADALSGVAACTSTTYAGPDAAAASLSGTCSDRAGNVSAPLTTTLPYDATAPALTDVSATPAEAAATVRWTASPDAVSIRVDRAPGRGGAASSVVYQGVGSSVDDDGLQGATRYTYTVTAVDAAGNAATATASVVPTGTLLAPAPGTKVTRPPLLRWRPVKGARYYNVQLFRGRAKVLSTWPAQAHLQLRSAWTYRGRRHRLAAGRYRWYVWPGYGPRARRHYGRLLGRRTFTIA